MFWITTMFFKNNYYKIIKNSQLIAILLCLKFVFAQCNDDAEEEQITYYENLINTEINKAFHYKLPTSAEAYRPKNNLSIEDFGTYDFIVVGSGPGGSVVANRLSEIKQWNVLLLEAGGPESNFSNIPGMHFYLLSSKFNWNFNTVRQTNACLGMVGNICPMPRGKALGGSSAINALMYSRGNKNNYDKWANEGNVGWSYQDVLSYFIKSENSQIKGDPGYHGRKGYWNVKYHRPNSEQINAFVEGGKLAHKSLGTDYNGKEQLGTFYSQINNIGQFRQSAYKAFLNPIKERPNLKILTRSYVTKIVVHPVKTSVKGVQFTRDGKTYFVKARKEVILSAGVINSPQILMLSGIGPHGHLQKMGVPLIKDLPVGKTLYDHHLFYGAYVSTNSSEPELSLRESIKQFLHDYGPLTIALNSQGIGFYQSKFENNSNYPDIELEINPGGGVSNNFLRRTLRVTDEVYDALFKNLNYQTTLSVYIFLLTSRSIGKILLRSKDAFEYPIIHTNFLSNDDDVEKLYEGLKILEDILKTEPLQKINASLVYADYPQCRDFAMGSKDYWICALRLLTASGYHQTGTCRMGPNPINSVVDSKAKVHGINNLRVVDSSVIPLAVAAHTTAPTVMVGERVSDLIKLDHRLSIDPITNVIN